MDYKKDERLSKLIENKRIVLIGPAQYLVGKGLGKIINGYDIVCRVNYMSPCSFEVDFGNRTDIMFYNCSTGSIGQMKKHFDDYPKYSKKLKLAVCPCIKVLGPEKWTEWGPNFVSPTVANFNSINTYNIDFCPIGVGNYNHLFNMIKCQEPNSGILAILMILKHNPKELFLTGFTFYKNKNDTYFKGYATRSPGWAGVSGHPQDDQIKFFRNYILSQGIKVDSYLNKLLQLKHNNIQKI
jgi:hypothetical protein